MQTSAIARKCVCSLVALLVAMVTSLASAQSGDSRVLAQSLFQEGKRLLDAGKIDPACEKLEESQKLDPAGGTLLNLARCHELQGKIATAWTDFQGVLEMSKRARRPDRMAHAKKKIDELGPKVPYLTLRYAGTAPLPGLKVRLDGVALSAATLDTSLALDPGEHVVSAEAEGHEPFEARVTLAEREKKTVAIGPLEPVRKAPPPRPEPVSSRPGWLLPTAIVTGGLGLAAHLVTLGTGVRALDLGKEGEAACPGLACSQAGLDAVESGRDFATAADVSLVIGIVLGAGSATLFAVNYIWFTDEAPGGAPPTEAASLHVVPHVELGRRETYGVGVRGTF
jgi:hypothetical protein